MAKSKSKPHADPDLVQPPLVPMSAEELDAARQKLPRLIGELEEMETEHADEKADMTKARKKLRNEIAALASIIRNQGR